MNITHFKKLGISLVVVCVAGTAVITVFWDSFAKPHDLNVPVDTTSSRENNSTTEAEPQRPEIASHDHDHTMISGPTSRIPPGTITPVDMQSLGSSRESVDIQVSSWRRLRENLDNVYTQPEIIRIRQRFVKRYIAKSAQADQERDWLRRNIRRVTARSQLKKGATRLEELYKTATDTAVKEECMLAIAELLYKAHDYEKSIPWGRRVIDEVANKRLEMQAIHYISNAYAKLGDADNSLRYIRIAFDFFPHDARLFYTGGHMDGRETVPDGYLRQLVDGHEMAQTMDDMALQHPGNAGKLRKLRDDIIADSHLNFAAASLPMPDTLELESLDE